MHSEQRAAIGIRTTFLVFFALLFCCCCGRYAC